MRLYWSDEEISILKQNCNLNVRELSKLLPDRTEKAILIKKDKLKLSKPKGTTKSKVQKEKSRVNWLDSEIALLKKCKSLDEAKRLLPHYTEKRIVFKLQKLKISFKEDPLRWSLNDEEYLIENYSKMNLDELVSNFKNRTKSGITQKARKLGLVPFSDKPVVDRMIVDLYLKSTPLTEISRLTGLCTLTIRKRLIHNNVNYKRIKLIRENHHRWKGVSSEIQEARRSEEYKRWRYLVFCRDHFTCVLCKRDKSGMLEAHHIENFSESKEKRFLISNGITLCKDCHSIAVKGSFHNLYGTRDNTLAQLQEYFDTKRTLLNMELLDINKYLIETKDFKEE